MAISRKMSKRSRRMGKSRATKATMKKTASKRVARKSRKVSKRAGRKSRLSRRSRKASRKPRKMSSYQKFIKSHKKAINAEHRRSGKKFLSVAAVMYKASGAKPASKKMSMRKSRKMSAMPSAPSRMRLRALFSRLPGQMAAKKTRRMSKRAGRKSRLSRKSRVSRRKSRLSKKSRKASRKSRVAKKGGRKVSAYNKFVKEHMAEAKAYAKEHGMMGPKANFKAIGIMWRARK